MRLAVFVSGSGSLLPGLFDLEKKRDDFDVVCVVSHREGKGLETAKNKAKTTLITEEFGAGLLSFLEVHKVDTIFLAGFLKILPKAFIDEFSGEIYNVHPSLLPDFGGRGMYGDNVHKAVAQSEAKETGFTVHKVSAEIDEGQIVFQEKLKIAPEDDWQEISQKVRKLELNLVPVVFERILNQNNNLTNCP